MVRMLALFALSFALVLPASASQPGQPLDCSDMVFHVPGLTCTPFVPIGGIPAGSPELNDLWWRGTNLAVDNLGSLLFVKQISNGTIELRRRDATTEIALATISIRTSPFGWDGIHPREACGFNSCGDNFYVAAGIMFDAANGRALIPLISKSSAPGGSVNGYPWIAAIEGFTTTFEVLQTYTPTTNTLGFRVPYMPEGLSAADHFDTYYGALTNPIDFATAEPLQCGYPARPPSTGDYLTVADPLPNPAVGTGRYYVTAVSYQGQRRYGRQRVDSVLSGRNPGLLPTCQQ